MGLMFMRHCRPILRWGDEMFPVLHTRLFTLVIVVVDYGNRASRGRTCAHRCRITPTSPGGCVAGRMGLDFLAVDAVHAARDEMALRAQATDQRSYGKKPLIAPYQRFAISEYPLSVGCTSPLPLMSLVGSVLMSSMITCSFLSACFFTTSGIFAM
jgi:hypothetical protein